MVPPNYLARFHDNPSTALFRWSDIIHPRYHNSHRQRPPISQERCVFAVGDCVRRRAVASRAASMLRTDNSRRGFSSDPIGWTRDGEFAPVRTIHA